MTAVSVSTRNSKLNWSAPDDTQCSTVVTLASPLPVTNDRKIGQLSAQLVNSAPVVRIFDANGPMARWPSPAISAAKSGRKTIAWITGLSLHPVGIVDGNRAAPAEINNKNGEADGGLPRGYRQHEHREHLSDQVVQRGAERDEVDVHRQQNEFDRHQDDNDILAVDEDAEDAKREEHRRNGEIMADRNHSSIPDRKS